MNTAEIGHWYQLDKMQDPVEVIGLDDEESIVEFQHFAGEIEALQADEWQSRFPMEVEAPLEWNGPYEMDRQDTNPEKLFTDYHLE